MSSPLKMSYAEIRLGQAVRLLVPAYADFVAHHSHLFDNAQLTAATTLIEHFLAIPLTVVAGQVVGVEMKTSICPDCMLYTLHCMDGQTISILSILPTR